MTRDQLIDVMIYQLEAFNTTAGAVTKDTVHADILSDDGPGNATPKRIYKSFIRATFALNQAGDPAWPADWMTYTVEDLADELLSDDNEDD